jgi:hypothetical protein
MPMIAERGRESDGERQVPQPSALRRRHLAAPVGPSDTELTLREIDIAPFEGDHLAAPQPRLPTKEHDEMRSCIDRARRRDVHAEDHFLRRNPARFLPIR